MDQTSLEKMILFALKAALVLFLVYFADFSAVRDIVLPSLFSYLLRKVQSTIRKETCDRQYFPTRRLALTWKNQDLLLIKKLQSEKHTKELLLCNLFKYDNYEKGIQDEKQMLAWLLTSRRTFWHQEFLHVLPATPVFLKRNDVMRFERNRFASFNLVPLMELPPGTNPTRLARDGYYFDQRRRRVLCFACGKTHGEEHVEDCDREEDNEPFLVPHLPPSRQTEQPVAQVMNVVVRPPTPELDKSKSVVFAQAAPSQTISAFAVVGSQQRSVHPENPGGQAISAPAVGGSQPRSVHHENPGDQAEGGLSSPGHTSSVPDSDEELTGAVGGEMKDLVVQSRQVIARTSIQRMSKDIVVSDAGV